MKSQQRINQPPSYNNDIDVMDTYNYNQTDEDLVIKEESQSVNEDKTLIDNQIPADDNIKNM
jgi:hypothetical protein